jgi:uncharacterized protein
MNSSDSLDLKKTPPVPYDFGKKIPTVEEIQELLQAWNFPEGIRQHCIVVKDIALQIADRIKETNPDLDLELDVIEAGALLHDIGRIKSHGLEHGYIGGLLLREINVDERVVRCAMVHVLGGFTPEDIKQEFPANMKDIHDSLIPETIEEKIVCYADKHAEGTIQVNLKKRFSRWFKKHGKTPFLLKSRYRLLQIEKDIKQVML